MAWVVEEVVPFWRRGKWVTGAVIQKEEESGKRRIKLFKGRIKEDGKVEVTLGGEKLRVALTQRINIPSLQYWEKLKKEIDSLARRVWSGEKPKETPKTPTIFDFS